MPGVDHCDGCERLSRMLAVPALRRITMLQCPLCERIVRRARPGEVIGQDNTRQAQVHRERREEANGQGGCLR